MKLQISTTKQEFYKKYYQLLNGIFKLTKTELEVLAELSYTRSILSSNISSEDVDKLLFNSKNRKLVTTNLGMSKFQFNNYLQHLKKRGFITSPSKGELCLHPKVYIDVNNIDELDLQIKFNITD